MWAVQISEMDLNHSELTIADLKLFTCKEEAEHYAKNTIYNNKLELEKIYDYEYVELNFIYEYKIEDLLEFIK